VGRRTDNGRNWLGKGLYFTPLHSVRFPPFARSAMDEQLGFVEGFGGSGSRFARISHLRDDETVAKMGHPVLWLGGAEVVNGRSLASMVKRSP
jgi:hypothetical protein